MRALAPAGEVLFFAPPKKSAQKKGGPKACPLTRVPCASRENRRLRNSQSRYARSLKQAQASSGFHCDARLRLREGRS